MADSHTDIERIVMRRVRLIRILYLIVSTAVLAGATFTVALWGIGREVWVAQVFRSGPQDFSGHIAYLFSAFLHTRFVVQALITLTVASLALLLREVVRLLVASH